MGKGKLPGILGLGVLALVALGKDAFESVLAAALQRKLESWGLGPMGAEVMTLLAEIAIPLALAMAVVYLVYYYVRKEVARETQVSRLAQIDFKKRPNWLFHTEWGPRKVTVIRLRAKNTREAKLTHCVPWLQEIILLPDAENGKPRSLNSGHPIILGWPSQSDQYDDHYSPIDIPNENWIHVFVHDHETDQTKSKLYVFTKTNLPSFKNDLQVGTYILRIDLATSDHTVHKTYKFTWTGSIETMNLQEVKDDKAE